MLRLQGYYQTKKKAWMALVFVLTVPQMVLAGHPVDGSTNASSNLSKVWALKTNLLSDIVVRPSLGLEMTVASNISLGISGTYGWISCQPWHDNIRLATADMELRYWFGNNSSALLKGLHAGIYGAVYRYEFLFDGKGQQAKINWGTGISGGYTVPLGSCVSLDFGLFIGYIGGRYKKYEVSVDTYHHNVWTEEKSRNYVGPAKAEISLIWLFSRSLRSKKGGKP